MQTISIADVAPPEELPVGSVVGFDSFVGKLQNGALDGRAAYGMREGFMGRDIDPLMSLIFGQPFRTEAMQEAIDRAGIDRDAIIMEILKGPAKKQRGGDPNLPDQMLASAADFENIEGYWIADWSRQAAEEVDTRGLVFVRVL